PQTVYVRVEDTITGCHSTTTLELQVGGAISVTPPSALTFFDPDNDGFGAFDLEQATPEITGGNPDLEVTYHETITNAENNVLPLESPYANIVDYQQTLWVRVENTAITTSCPTIVALQLIVNDTPDIVEPSPLILCDDDTDGYGVFNLTDKNTEILNGLDPVRYIVSYYETEADAEVPTGAISTPESYTNTESGTQTVWVRVDDTDNGCYRIIPLELIVNTLPLATQPTPLELCDDEVADEITVFDLTEKNEEIMAGNTVSVAVDYYETQAAALAGIGAIDPADTYTNTAVNGNPPNPQTLFVRVTDTNTGCFALTTLTIRVLPNPTPTQNLAPLELCDDTNSGDMTEEFDLTGQETLLLNGEAGVSPTYHESLSDAETGENAIATPGAYTNISSPQTIYIRVTNDTTGCYTIVTLSLTVHPVPANMLSDTYVLCIDTNGTEVVGTPILDTGLSSSDYSFQWSYEGIVQTGATGPTYEATATGAYSVWVTDNLSGCSVAFTTEVIESSPPVVTAEVTTEAFADTHIIEVTATGTGSSSVFEYSLDNGPWQESNIFSGVSPGSHEIRARDINGCGWGIAEVF